MTEDFHRIFGSHGLTAVKEEREAGVCYNNKAGITTTLHAELPNVKDICENYWINRMRLECV